VTVRGLRDSLSITDSGLHSRTSFEASFADFCVITFRQYFLQRHLKETACSKFGRMSIGGPLLAGGPTHVRTVLNG